MAQSGYTPIVLYASGTATNTPTSGNLASGELAINYADGKLFYKDSSGVVQVLATKGGVGSSTTTQVLYNNAGAIAGSANFVFDGSNVGIGVTPSAWNTSVFKALQINAQGALMATSATMQMGNNIFYDGAYKFIGTGYANRYYQSTGQHVWTVSTASGTAGGTITETQAMTLDASGNVGIGTSSPTVALDVGPASGTTTNTVVRINGGGTAGYGPQLRFASASTLNATIGTDQSILGGTSSDLSVYIPTATAFRVYTNATERMRIDSSGRLLVGTTTNIGSSLITESFSSNTGPGLVISDSTIQNGSTFVGFYAASTRIGSVTAVGTTAVVYNTTSDYRLKTNATPIQNALATVEALNPVSFTWVDGRPDDGFLAHEIQAVIPNCVTGEKDAVNEDGTPKYQQMDNSGVIPFLVKAIQEQQALIESLTTRLTSLESK